MNRLTLNQSTQIILVVMASLFLFFSIPYVIINEKVNLVFSVIGFSIILMGLFTIRFEQTPILLMLSLVLGSFYMYWVVNKTFYLRFIVMLFVLFKGLSMIQIKFKRRSPLPNVSIIMLSFCLIQLIFVTQSVDIQTSSLRLLTFVIMIMLVFVLMPIYFDTKEKYLKYVHYLLLGFVCIVFLSWFFLISGQAGMFKGGRLRLILTNPNQLGHFCALFLPILVWKVFSQKGNTRLYQVALLLSVAALLGSGSRAGMLAAFLCVSIQLFLLYPKKAFFIITVLGLLVSIGLLFELQTKSKSVDQFVETNLLRSYSITSGSGRVGVWKEADRLIQKKPLLGYGFASTDKLFEKGYFENLPLEFQGGHVHNGFIEEILNTGYLGIMFLIVTWLVTMIKGLKYLFLYRHSELFHLNGAIFFMFLVGLVSSFFESWLSSVGSVFCYPFWLVVSLIGQFERMEKLT